MNETTLQINDQPKANHSLVSGILQRKCACGNHTGAGGECAECSKKEHILQRKLTIGASNDSLEQEADRVADQVLSMPANPAISNTPLSIQRFAGEPSDQIDEAPPSVGRVLTSSGQSLEPALRDDMEQRFGYDFSGVRVHSGAAAEQSAREVNARAYTAGHNIVFATGQFVPSTHEGRRLIAHELAHVVQQMDPSGIRANQSYEKRGLSPVSLLAHELTYTSQQKVGRSSTQVPTVQRLREGEGPILSCPPLPDPDGDWAQERWLCEMRQEPLGSNKRLLAPGASGRSVELVHQVLQHWLCSMSKTEPPKHTLPDHTSSVFTEQSSAVVLDFQRFSHALMKEGVVGPETISLLDGYVGGPDVPPVDCGIPKPEPEPKPKPEPHQPRGCFPECFDIYGEQLPLAELPDSCNIVCPDRPNPKRKREPDLMDDKTQEWEAKIDSMATGCTPGLGIGACVSLGTVFIRSKSSFGGKGRLFMSFNYHGEGGGLGCPAGVSYDSDWEPFTTTEEVGISDFAGDAVHRAVSFGAYLGKFSDELQMSGPISKGASKVLVEWEGIVGGFGCGGNIDIEGELYVGHRPRRLK